MDALFVYMNSIHLAFTANRNKGVNRIVAILNSIPKNLAYARDLLISRVVGGICQIIDAFVDIVAIDSLRYQDSSSSL